MRKILFLLVCVFVAFGVAKAGIPDKKIVLKGHGSSVEYILADIVSLKFSNGDVFINMNDGTTASWSTENIGVMSIVYYEPSPETGIGETRFLPFSFSDGSLTIASDMPIQVFLSTVDGKILFGGSCNGELHLSLKNYPAGLYLLNADGVIYKIMNR